MKKNVVIGINVTTKDAKKIVELAGLLAQIFTPTEETPVAVITEAAPAKKAKKATAKKATKAAEEKPAKATKKSKKSTLKKITVGTLRRITLPHSYLNDIGARGGQVDVLKKYTKDDAAYFIPAGASYNRKNYKHVKTVDFNHAGQVAIGDMIDGIVQGDEVRVNLRGNKIVVRK